MEVCEQLAATLNTQKHYDVFSDASHYPSSSKFNLRTKSHFSKTIKENINNNINKFLTKKCWKKTKRSCSSNYIDYIKNNKSNNNKNDWKIIDILYQNKKQKKSDYNYDYEDSSYNLKSTLSTEYTDYYSSEFQLFDVESKSNKTYEHVLKFIVIGDKSTGKTSFIQKFVENDRDEKCYSMPFVKPTET
jgi:hypothetical protein